MKNLKFKLLLMLTIFFSFAVLISCNKEQPFVEPEMQVDFSQMSLKEFAASVASEQEIAFFQNSEIIDNKKSVKKAIFEKIFLKSEASRIKIKFKWGGSGCVNPIGICIIIPLPTSLEENAEFIETDGKFVVFPLTDDNGITSDGYLPIFEDILIDENTTIKAGIYTAYFDEQENKYTAIALDLK